MNGGLGCLRTVKSCSCASRSVWGGRYMQQPLQSIAVEAAQFLKLYVSKMITSHIALHGMCVIYIAATIPTGSRPAFLHTALDACHRSASTIRTKCRCSHPSHFHIVRQCDRYHARICGHISGAYRI